MTDNSILVSVILPVYKAENYIMRCLRTIGLQTLKGVEYIFVDDASPDRSADIIRNFLRPLRSTDRNTA